MVKVGDLKITHVIMVAIVAFVLYSLMSSYSSDGFSVGGQSEPPAKIPVCCVNLYNSNFPDDIKKLRGSDPGSDPETCATEIYKFIGASNNDFKIKEGQYSKLFGCDENAIVEYCKNTDDKLYQWKDKYMSTNISYNSSNTTDSCDFLQFLDNTTLENKKYGKQSFLTAEREFLYNPGIGDPPKYNDKYSSLLRQDHPALKHDNICIGVINDLFTKLPASKDFGKFNSQPNLLFRGVGANDSIPGTICNHKINYTDVFI
jgi:hypothetical protein